MIYFCADDYGISNQSNIRIEECLEKGVLNKVSILINGELEDFKHRLSAYDAQIALHINLVEGYPTSDKKDVSMLITDRGYFKYSFIGLFFLSFSAKRKLIENQIYNEIRSQIKIWKRHMGESFPVSIDSHQHTHMIPIVFKALMRAVEDEGIDVKYMRIPAEPILPYILTPSLYFDYNLSGLVKQWLLKILALSNCRRLKKLKIHSAYFMGVMFSGRLNEQRIKKLLPQYLKLAEKNDKNIEIGFHPGYVKKGEKLIKGHRKGFRDFYLSPRRKTEYDTLLNFKFE